MSDLPTRESLTRYFVEGGVTHDLVNALERIARRYADGTLQTRQEFIDSLDYEAAAKYAAMISHWLSPRLLSINEDAAKRDVRHDILVREIDDRLKADLECMFDSALRNSES